MITTYFLIAAFVAGMFAGGEIETKHKSTTGERVLLVVLAIFWPVTIYIYWKGWRNGA